MQKNSDYKPTYAILYPGEATDWGNASNDNRLQRQRSLKRVFWLVAATGAASAYFLFQ